jgi:hypothetical protein
LKLAGLVSFIILLFSGCSNILSEANYYKFTDDKGKSVFQLTDEGTELFLCKETKRGVCLLFDKSGEYLEDTTPDKCHKIKDELYCPIPSKTDSIKKEIVITPKVNKEKIEEKVIELQKIEDIENPKRTAKEILRDWWNK